MPRFYSFVPLIAAFALPLTAVERAQEITAPRLVGEVLVGNSGSLKGGIKALVMLCRGNGSISLAVMASSRWSERRSR